MPSVLKNGAAKKRSSEFQLAKSDISITSFGEILIMSPVQQSIIAIKKAPMESYCTVLLMEVRT